ncbi:hypothetical protein [Salinirussus salinus]|uniref:hypothetical protein n=1 Tax=Salinirussus salinus TaxID=1198300 RepID=UPI00135A7ADD|nr:hypothetical protein [Salinirussus salinus]
MSNDKVIAYAVEIREYRNQASVITPGKYLEIPLPEEVTDFEDVEIGEKSFYAHLERAEDFSYLRYTPEDDGSRHHLTLKEKSGSDPSLAVSLPAEFAVTNDRSPFQGMQHGDRVNIEIREEENEIRVYTPEDFPHRVRQLSEEGTLTDFDTPVIAPLLATGDGFSDLTVSADAPSQKFEIVPFDGQHKGFVEVAEEYPIFRSRTQQGFRGGPKPLNIVKDKYGIPTVEADITVKWAPEAAPSMGGGGDVIYTKKDSSSAKVELQEKGSYSVLAEKDGDHGGMWLAPDPNLAMTDPIRESWSAFLYDDDEEWEAPKIYIPVNVGEEKGHWPQR